MCLEWVCILHAHAHTRGYDIYLMWRTAGFAPIRSHSEAFMQSLWLWFVATVAGEMTNLAAWNHRAHPTGAWHGVVGVCQKPKQKTWGSTGKKIYILVNFSAAPLFFISNLFFFFFLLVKLVVPKPLTAPWQPEPASLTYIRPLREHVVEEAAETQPGGAGEKSDCRQEQQKRKDWSWLAVGIWEVQNVKRSPK